MRECSDEWLCREIVYGTQNAIIFSDRDGYRKVMESGSTRYGQELLAVPATRKDGARISIEFSIVLLRSPDGVVLGLAAFIRDVTARWLKEKELKDRLAALEKRG